MSKVDKLTKSKAQAAADAKIIKPLLKKYDLKTLKAPATPKTDADFKRVHLAQYRTLQLLVRKLEKDLLDPKKDSSKGIYPLLQVYTHLRETTAELRAITTLNEQADKLIDMIMKPMFTDIAQKFTDNIYEAKAAIRPRLDAKKQKEIFDTMDTYTRQIGPCLQDVYNTYRAKLQSLLLEDEK